MVWGKGRAAGEQKKWFPRGEQATGRAVAADGAKRWLSVRRKPLLLYATYIIGV